MRMAYCMKHLVFISFCCLVLGCADQKAESVDEKKVGGFSKAFGGSWIDRGVSVQPVPGGGYLIAGQTMPAKGESSALLVIQTDSAGNQEWRESYSIRAYDVGITVLSAASIPYYVHCNGMPGAYLFQISSDGSLAGRTAIESENQEATLSLDAGVEVRDGFAFCGSGHSNHVPELGMVLVKTNKQGRVVWERSFGRSGGCSGRAIVKARDGYLVAGHKNLSGGNWDVWLVKADESGNMQWERTYGLGEPGRNRSEEVGRGLVHTADNGFIVVADTDHGEDKRRSLLLIKIDSFGNEEWRNVITDNNWNVGSNICEAHDGNYIVVGATSGRNGSLDVWLIKIKSSGDIVWQRTYGGPEDDWGNEVHQNDEGGYIVVGTTKSYGSGRESVYLIKTDTNGIVK